MTGEKLYEVCFVCKVTLFVLSSSLIIRCMSSDPGATSFVVVSLSQRL
jgi:hypothetical protein